MREQLLKLLSAANIEVPANATDEQLTALAEQAAQKLTTLSAADAAKQGEKTSEMPAGLKAEIDGLKTTLTTLAATINGIQAHGEAQQITLILNSAAAEGKVVPKWATEGDHKLDPAKLKLLVADLPVTVPVSDRRTPHTVPPADGVLVTNSAADQVRKQLGLSEEEWKAIK